MILPQNNKAEHEGKVYNWFIGDAAKENIDDFHWNGKDFWAWAVPVDKGWNTRSAEYCGKFNSDTREIREILKLETE